ncbi:hypothetical protein GCM10010214_62270 [Streptomyces abikoensis]|nr:hypothetical protein GCM10010214_62270 [Streptomyces abikoensis]
MAVPRARLGGAVCGAGAGPRGSAANVRILMIVTLRGYQPTHGHTSSVADGSDIRQTPRPKRGFRLKDRARHRASAGLRVASRARRELEFGPGVLQ